MIWVLRLMASKKKNVILAVVTLVLFLGGLCEAGILGALRRNYQRRFGRFSHSVKANRVTGARTSYTVVHNQLRQRTDISDFGLNTTFGDAIEILRKSTKPALNIVVLWRDLSENTYIERDTPIRLEGVRGISAGFALELLLRAVSSRSGELGYVVQGGVIIIASKESLPVKKEVRVYNISDLAAGPANFGFGFGAYPNWMRMPGEGPVRMAGWGRRGSSRGRGMYSRGTARRRR
jgi:hypothetical protein